MSEYDSIINEFIAEAKEHLDNIEEDFLALEKQKENPKKEMIDKVFRAIHSIKGAAASLGYKNMTDLSHSMETLLQMIRSFEIKPETRYINALLSGSDLLNTMLDDIDSSNNVDIFEVNETLKELINKDKPTSSSAMEKETESKKTLNEIQRGNPDFTITEEQIKKIKKAHLSLFLLKFDFIDIQKNTGITPGSFIDDLEKLGDILNARIILPDDDSLSDVDEDGPLFYEVFFSTIMDVELLKAGVDLLERQITEISLDDPEKEIPLPKTTSTPEKKIFSMDKEKTPSKTKATRETVESVRISVNILDKLMNLAGELVLVRNQVLMSTDTKGDSKERGMSQRLNLVTTELQESIMQTRMQPIGNVFGKLPRIVRDVSIKLNKQIEMIVEGSDVGLDKTLIETLSDPLVHIIRNCCDHGIETPEVRVQKGKPPKGQISIEAFHEGGQVNITIKDDGAGINPQKIRDKVIEKGLKTEAELSGLEDEQLISLISLPGFSTAEEISDVSGRGVGMDVVRMGIEHLGGALNIQSEVDKGTTVYLKLPLTLAIIPCLIVTVDNWRLAIPQVNLEELVCLYEEDIENKIELAGDQVVYRLRDNLLPLVSLKEVLNRKEKFTKKVSSEIMQMYVKTRGDIKGKTTSLFFAVVKAGDRRFGLIVDKVIRTEEIVVKPLHNILKKLNIYSGATIMGDGRVAFILDIEGVFQHAGVEFVTRSEEFLEKKDAMLQKEIETQMVLLFKSGQEEQFAVSLTLVKRIERIEMKNVEKIGGREFITIDGVSTLVLRIDKVLNFTRQEDSKEMFLLIPKYVKKPFGILISKLIDTLEIPMKLNVDSYQEDGVLGTNIIRDKMTVFIDIFRLIEKLEPHWFKAMANKNSRKEKITILLLEDTSFFTQLVKGYLESDGYQVLNAINGIEGLKILEANKNVNLIVSDIEMPGMNGIEFIETIRANPSYEKLPAIALTSLDSEEMKKKALNSGFDKYLIKIDREGLLFHVDTMFENHAGMKYKRGQRE